MRALVIATFLVVIVVALFPPFRQTLDPARATAFLRSIGSAWWAPIVFIALYSIFNVLLVPATLLTLTAGAVWGWWVGGLWVLVASTIGSAIPYVIARSMAAEWMDGFIRRRADPIRERLANEGLVTLLVMRLVPLVPYNLLNYAAGLAAIRPRDYFAATFVGTIPGIFIFTYLADSIAAGLVSPREAFVRVLVAGALLAGLVVATRIASRRMRWVRGT